MAFHKSRNMAQAINRYKFICDWRSALPCCYQHVT